MNYENVALFLKAHAGGNNKLWIILNWYKQFSVIWYCSCAMSHLPVLANLFVIK